MLTYTDLTKGTIFILDGEPYEVLEYAFLRMQQRKPVVQTKIKNLISGKIVPRNFHQNETFKEAEIEKEEFNFIYSRKGEYWFNKKGDPKQRFLIPAETIGEQAKFLKPNTTVVAQKFQDKIIAVSLPIKMDFKVLEAPPAIRGGTASGGGKTIILENGLKIQAPFFIEEGDMVRVNTQTGEYIERAGRSKLPARLRLD